MSAYTSARHLVKNHYVGISRRPSFGPAYANALHLVQYHDSQHMLPRYFVKYHDVGISRRPAFGSAYANVWHLVQNHFPGTIRCPAFGPIALCQLMPTHGI